MRPPRTNPPRRVWHARRARPAAALLALTALTACGGQPPAADAPAPVTRFTENGVTVALSVSAWQASKGTLTAVFTPEDGFHLYSTELPATGIEGVGRPTAMNVTGALTAEGEPKAASKVSDINLPGVDAPVPVYPDGPVTVTLPVRAGADGDATVLFGYASCSTREGCTIPVTDHPVRLRVTGDGPRLAAP
ncbi:protein-disulfide reductase DsbD family protein [Streptomyces sp. Isolate_45]|uniref:protein-disulfide reductase DsbD family protein n=1 Tax=Streptomyces sp. Isolate_45 TaxID=2950111 RepID=UPI002481FA73|nr:protein-disulfide reductase DsbD family protein [Streptomyces sp. Isolate_45]MDA5279318.1 protein-disulfide reductase DsbD family protein [Streptomyces sp. Isolate_45]